MRALSFLLLGLALLAPAAAQDGCQPGEASVLEVLNALRARPRACGEHVWPAAAPLRGSPLLAQSARRYAQELAARDRLDHVGAAGTSLRMRLREAGYPTKSAGENLAGGPESLDEALAQWLASPVHCDNLMAPDFQEVGLACVEGPGRLQRYWVLQLAVPLRSSPGRSP
jgi:uncharacterized protein YkwD